MAKRREIDADQLAEIEAARKVNKNKNVERRLKAVSLHGQGYTREQIAMQTGYDATNINKIVRKYCIHGLDALVGNHYGGNRRNMSIEQESKLLEPFLKAAAAGQIVEVSEIKAAYESAIGRPLNSHGQIYYVLKRNGWRKVMPRSQHPNKASEEAMEASKKLTPQ